MILAVVITICVAPDVAVALPQAMLGVFYTSRFAGLSTVRWTKDQCPNSTVKALGP